MLYRTLMFGYKLQYLNMFYNLMLTYQCFISCGHNWQLVNTHFTYGVAIQEIKTYQTKLFAMHWTFTFTGFTTKIQS